MDERRDLVDREELRRRLEENFSESNTHAWVGAHRSVLSHLDAMPAVECPRGWTRDEVLAELDADPDAAVQTMYSADGSWGHYAPEKWVRGWRNPEVRRYDVRVVRVAPGPEWVPLTQLVGHTIDGCHVPVSYQPVHHTGQWWWQGPGGATHAFPEGTLNLETGQVTVVKGEA